MRFAQFRSVEIRESPYMDAMCLTAYFRSRRRYKKNIGVGQTWLSDPILNELCIIRTIDEG